MDARWLAPNLYRPLPTPFPILSNPIESTRIDVTLLDKSIVTAESHTTTAATSNDVGRKCSAPCSSREALGNVGNRLKELSTQRGELEAVNVSELADQLVQLRQPTLQKTIAKKVSSKLTNLETDMYTNLPSLSVDESAIVKQVERKRVIDRRRLKTSVSARSVKPYATTRNDTHHLPRSNSTRKATG